jgi:collagen type III alpha
LTADEVRPQFRGGERGGGDMNRMFEAWDRNHDGKLSKSEMPERMQEMFERLDANKDGFVSKEEMGAMMGRRRE